MISLILTFFKAQWRVILPVLIVGAGLLYLNHLQNSRDQAIADLNAFKVQAQAEVDKQIAINQLNLAKAQAEISRVDQEAQAQILSVLQLSEKTINQLSTQIRNRYETKYALDITAGRVLPQSTSGDPIAETSSTAEGLASRQPNTDPACAGLRDEITDLENACALTTIYFNQCRAALDADAMVLERADSK